MIEKTCERCGAPFEVHAYRAETARFCSLRCRRVPHLTDCACCGESFRSPPGDQRRFCSYECYWDDLRGGPRVLVQRPCEHCGVSFSATPSQIESEGRRFCSRRCGARSRATGKAPYVHVGDDREHRVVAARMLGRPLRLGEVVHHINGNGRDNRPENLQVLPSQSAHKKLHLAEKPQLRGAENPLSKLDSVQREDLIRRQALGESYSMLARRFGIAVTTAWHIVNKQERPVAA